jgi:hypothetical protein
MFKILEIIWLVMACVGVIVCGVMYLVRKKQRIKYNQHLSASTEPGSKEQNKN